MHFLTVTMLLLGLSFNVFTQAEPLNALQSPLILEQAGNYSIGLQSAWLEDPDISFSPQQVLKNEQWQISNSEYLNFGFSNSAYWLAVK